MDGRAGQVVNETLQVVRVARAAIDVLQVDRDTWDGHEEDHPG